MKSSSDFDAFSNEKINIIKYLGAVDGKHQWSDLKEGGFPALAKRLLSLPRDVNPPQKVHQLT